MLKGWWKERLDTKHNFYYKLMDNVGIDVFEEHLM